MRLLKSVALSVLAISCSAFAQMPRIELTAGMYRIDAEVAVDQPSRMQGLMNRKSMAPHHGMLFAFPEPAMTCMWMRNTLIPLSVAFIDGEGKIINIEDMAPQTEDNHCTARPARYALEMNRGWFASKGLKAGSHLGGLDKVPPASR